MVKERLRSRVSKELCHARGQSIVRLDVDIERTHSDAIRLNVAACFRKVVLEQRKREIPAQRAIDQRHVKYPFSTVLGGLIRGDDARLPALLWSLILHDVEPIGRLRTPGENQGQEASVPRQMRKH
jgi:hypothetical protein